MASHQDPGPSKRQESGTPIPEDENNEPEMPMTMAASVVLSSLPKNAHEALEGAGELPQAKGTIWPFRVLFERDNFV